MRFSELKQDKGVAGLTILLSLIVMLFVIGLIVMIFTLMGNEMRTATYDTTTVSVSNESVTSSALAGLDATLGGGAYRDAVCSNATIVYNSTVGMAMVIHANITQTGCAVVNATAFDDYGDSLLFTYDYTWNADNTATDVMNDTVSGISGVTAWFSIFIIIGSMVVLILLTVIIISAIKGSGMIQGGATPSRQSNIGSA